MKNKVAYEHKTFTSNILYEAYLSFYIRQPHYKCLRLADCNIVSEAFLGRVRPWLLYGAMTTSLSYDTASIFVRS